MRGRFGEACFRKKMLKNALNIGLTQWALVKMTVHWTETYWLSAKEKLLGATVSKKDHTDSLLEHLRTHHYWLSCCIYIKVNVMYYSASYFFFSILSVNAHLLTLVVRHFTLAVSPGGPLFCVLLFVSLSSVVITDRFKFFSGRIMNNNAVTFFNAYYSFITLTTLSYHQPL